jgi:hypothetical protein
MHPIDTKRVINKKIFMAYRPFCGGVTYEKLMAS